MIQTPCLDDYGVKIYSSTKDEDLNIAISNLLKIKRLFKHAKLKKGSYLA